MKTKTVTKNFEETQKLGEEFAKSLMPRDVICLYGDLGAGKTTFMQGLAKGFGIKHRIISPTFIIVRKYLNDDGSEIKSLYHIDLYRTETEDDLKGLGIPEILEEKDGIVAIEWPEKMMSLMPGKRWDIHFKWLTENQ
ncbi:MAG TPA: tRNA (adenosine(37)-N6)-threonylcarbamoyltransferase complex ATPase subunit type 1 TsaE, partial [Patescibacteria group bacterium]